MTGVHPGVRGQSAAPGPGIADAPETLGGLSTREEDLTAASDDFGHLVHRRPLAVLHPRDASDVAAAAAFARERGLPVVARGAGHTVDGQSQIRGGIVVDLGSLADVAWTRPDRISIGAGARWSAVIDATLPAGSAPPVLPDYLELSVGGTLSAGGIGGATHRHGCIADNVHDLDVVTPDGDLVTCSPSQRADLFDAVRGTQGEHGIIVRATLTLAPANTDARRYLLTYHDLGAYLADQRRLTADRRFDHVVGQAQIGPDGRWRYVLDAMAAFTAVGEPDGPDDRQLLGDLGFARGTEQIATTSYRAFLDRLVPFEAQLRSTGSWQHHPHPRCNVMLPGRHAEAIVTEVLGDLTAELLGAGPLGGSVLLYAIPTAQLAAPNMPKAQDPVTVVFGLQRTAPPGDSALLAEMQRANLALHALAHSVGGASYAYPTEYHEALHRNVG